MRENKRLQMLKVRSTADASAVKPRQRAEKKRFDVKSGSYDERLLQAGIAMSKEIYVPVVFICSLGMGYLATSVGMLLGIFVSGIMAHYLCFVYIRERSIKRRRMVIPLLPGFIDGLASALSTGFNLEGAVAQAVQAVPSGLLRDELDRVVLGISRGLTVEEAFSGLKRRIAGREITSLAVALVLFSGMGGRMLEPIRRLARKTREQQTVVERANRDLVQIRQAFWIIAFLSVFAPAALLIVAPNY
ncbi:MAG: type II secretion system F family protein, partial [Bdellovibrionales bacterium]|nr:type II secretion system F family protein [Bdellovibrionales bacterium]